MPREKEFHYLDKEAVTKLDEVSRAFLTSSDSLEGFIAKIKELLPVHKTDQTTWKTRVEGFYEVSEILFQAVLEKGVAKFGEDWNRQRVVVEAKMRPFSYYHWITGSREPVANVLTRDDYLNDATTALVKLEDDIIALAKLYRGLN